jgi:UDP-glucoronosyl and UDP-glucosyl transferase.
MKWSGVLAILVTACCLLPAASYNILCFFPHVAKSHFIMAEELMKALAMRGFEITMVSHFPQKTPLKNYKDISLVGSMPEFVNSVPIDTLATGSPKTTLDFLAYIGYVTCENTLEHPAVKELIDSGEKFDLVVTELFNTDCLLGYVYRLNVPFIALSTSVMMPWAHERFGNPDNPSYLGNLFLPIATQMSFPERLINFIYEEGLKLWYYYMFDKPANELAKKYFGESLPPLQEIAKNTSLLLINTHFTLNHPRPLSPNIIEVGGLHLKQSISNLPEVRSYSSAFNKYNFILLILL